MIATRCLPLANADIGSDKDLGALPVARDDLFDVFGGRFTLTGDNMGTKAYEL